MRGCRLLCRPSPKSKPGKVVLIWKREKEPCRFLLTRWLGWRDSNPLYRSQSPVCYHYTTSQYGRTSAETARLSRAVAGKWGGIWGSNPRHPEPQSGALPTELIPPYQFLRREGGQTAAPGLLPPSGVGTPRGIRTPDLLLRRQLLYPAELLAHMRCTRLPGMERVMGIEPTYPAWKAGVLPLNYTRMAGSSFSLEIIPHKDRPCQQKVFLVCQKEGDPFFSRIAPLDFCKTQRRRRKSSFTESAKYSFSPRLIIST